MELNSTNFSAPKLTLTDKTPQKQHKTQKPKNWTKTGEKTKKTRISQSETSHMWGTSGNPPGHLQPAGHLRDISGTSPGNLRDISGTSPGHLRDNSGTPGHLRDNSGASPGQIEKSVEFPPKTTVYSDFLLKFEPATKTLEYCFWCWCFAFFSVGAFAPPKNGPNIRPVRPSYSPFPHEFFFGFYPARYEKHNLRASS